MNYDAKLWRSLMPEFTPACVFPRETSATHKLQSADVLGEFPQKESALVSSDRPTPSASEPKGTRDPSPETTPFVPRGTSIFGPACRQGETPPSERFDTLELSTARTPADSQTREHDQSYIATLKQIPQFHLQRIQLLLLAAIKLAVNSLEVLDTLLGLHLQPFHHTLQPLQPAISLQESAPDHHTLHFRNASFPEFLLDPKRSGVHCIDKPGLLAILLKKCILIINDAHDKLESDNTVPSILLPHDINSKSLNSLKWRVYKTAVQNLFSLWLQAELDPDSLRQLESLDFSKIFRFKERYESGVWQVYDTDTIKQVSKKSKNMIRIQRSGFFPLNLIFGESDLTDESGTYPKYVVGHGEKKAFLVPRKLFRYVVRYVLVPDL